MYIARDTWMPSLENWGGDLCTYACTCTCMLFVRVMLGWVTLPFFASVLCTCISMYINVHVSKQLMLFLKLFLSCRSSNIFLSRRGCYFILCLFVFFVFFCFWLGIYFYSSSFSLFLSSPFLSLLFWCTINVNFHVHVYTCF